MFEEATLYSQSEIPISPTNHPSKPLSKLSEFEVVCYWHQRHQIYIRQWLTIGYVKSKPSGSRKRWFLYSEYLDRQGNNTYIKNSFSSLDAALQYAESNILTMQLSGY